MKKQTLNQLLLLLFVGIFILHHFTSYLGHFGYDDMRYAKLAYNLAHGHFDTGDHYSYRLTLIGLTSLSYKLLGVNDLASSLPSLLVSILSLLLVYFVLKREKPFILALGLTFFTLNFWTLFYSDKLMPDAFVAFFILLTVYIIYRYRYHKEHLPTWFYGVAAAISLFLGFNSKGTIVLFFPLLAYFLVIDLLQKRQVKFWVYFAGFSFVLLVIYFAFWQIIAGNGFVRFQAIFQNSYLNLCSYSEQPFIFTLERISYGLIVLFITHSMITPLIFLLAFPKRLLNKEIFLLKDEVSFFISSTVVLFLSSNFMSISFSSYSPMCLDPRHYLFLTPIAGIAATYLLKDIFGEKSAPVRLFLITALIFIVALFSHSDTAWVLYFPLLLAFLVWYAFKSHRNIATIFAILLPLVLLVNPVKMAGYSHNVNFKKQEQIVREELLEKQMPCILITDDVQRNIAKYLSGFNDQFSNRIFSYSEFNLNDTVSGEPVFLLKNWYTGYLSNLNEQSLPYYAQMTESQEKVFEDSALHIQIYKLIDFRQPKILLKSINDFESNKLHWSNYEADEKHVYSGSYSSSVKKYSSTFNIPIDSLNPDASAQLIINSSFQFNQIESADPQFVISFDTDHGNAYWKGISFKKQIKSYGNWMPVSIHEIVELKDIDPNSTLKIYILNNDKKEMYLEDFSVELSQLPK